MVGWVTSDQDVTLGSQGRINGFSEDAVAVKFPFAEYLFRSDVLFRMGE